jgi:hypothetical protein
MNYTIEEKCNGLFFLRKLKFRNTIYSPGDDVFLLGGEGKDNTVLGKIALIAKVATLQFPILLVNWYYCKKDPVVEEQHLLHVAKKELIFSGYEDWVYVESLKGKINVLTEKKYRQLNPKEREDEKTYFCRNYFIPKTQNILDSLPRGVCHCNSPYNPDAQLTPCLLCGLFFHPSCSGNDELCIMCRD